MAAAVEKQDQDEVAKMVAQPLPAEMDLSHHDVGVSHLAMVGSWKLDRVPICLR